MVGGILGKFGVRFFGKLLKSLFQKFGKSLKGEFG